jgi:mRNA-degrading endonuclease RelE of RelBE toxin-antitoxin system
MRKQNEIVELSTFERAVASILSEPEIDQLKVFLSLNPEAGDLIQGTGGARKLRWKAQGKGKRGGGRVIYYFQNPELPLLLMDFYAKSAKHDLSEKEKKTLRSVIEMYVEGYG